VGHRQAAARAVLEQPGAYEIAFGSTWRIALASLIAFLCGEFVNSFVLAR